jgi:SAM-dependent methyltransferase
MTAPDLNRQLQKMQEDWEERAQINPHYFVNTARSEWTEADFYRSGEETVQQEILGDMTNICQGREPGQMRILEIGCGVGRLTRALSKVFGGVYGVDISAEMIRLARAALSDCPNAHVFQNNGMDLSVLPDEVPFDFAFSTLVFQHIPSREVIENYVRETHRVLRPGALFKFQVQGDCALRSTPDNTWVGVAFTEPELVDMAARCGFEPRYRHGAGGQRFWLWFFKQP